jgi:hypothetical protein
LLIYDNYYLRYFFHYFFYLPLRYNPYFVKKTFLYFLVLSISLSSFAQTYEYGRHIPRSFSNLSSEKISVDESGNIYKVGTFRDTIDVDSSSSSFNLVSSGNSDIFVLKYSPMGSLVWAYELGGIGTDQASDIDYDNGNLFITGFFSDTVDFDAGPNTNVLGAGYTAIFILKIDTSGIFKWVKKVDAFWNHEHSFDIEIDNQGNVLTTGRFSGNTDFDPGPGLFNMPSLGGWDMFVLKLDSNGNFLWAKSVGELSEDVIGYSLAIDPNDNVIVYGTFHGTVDFNPAIGQQNWLTHVGSNFEPFLLKFDLNGNFKWARTIIESGIIAQAFGNELRSDNQGNIYTIGSLNDTSDFKIGPGNESIYPSSTHNGFVCKIDSMGQLLWVRNLPSPLNNSDFGLAVDSTSAVCIGASFYGIVDFDSDTSSVYNLGQSIGGSLRSYLLKLDSNAEFLWAKEYTPSGNYTRTYDIEFGPNGSIYAAGVFIYNIDLDPGSNINSVVSYLPQNGYNPNGFLTKLNDCCWPYQTIRIDTCWNSIDVNGITYNSSGYFTQFFYDNNGCDSNTVYDINLHPSTVSTINLISCDSVSLGGTIFYTSGAFTDTLSSLNNCDSIIIYNYTINYTTSSSQTILACDSFVSPSSNYIWYTSGVYIDTLLSSSGCDSLVTINLTVNNSTTNSISQTSCDSYTLNSQTYTSSGAYAQIFQNGLGCDSTLILNLTIHSTNASASPNGLTLSASPNGSTYQWINCNPYTLISGATNQTYTVTSNGDYAVVVNQNGCSDTSDCIMFTNVGVDDILLDGVSVYPNPARSSFVITSKNLLNDASMKILNALGQVIYQNQGLAGTKFNIDISNFSNGLYTLELREGSKVSRLKVVKR